MPVLLELRAALWFFVVNLFLQSLITRQLFGIDGFQS